MRYAIRIVIGAVLGLVALVAMWLLGVRWWITAITAGLLAPLGFLGSFFLWTADRPEEGYEQVLFDAPNSILSGVMIVLMVGASFGVGLIHFGSAAPDPNAVALNTAHDDLVHLYNQLLQGKLTQDDAPGAKTNLSASQATLQKLPESAKQKALLSAAKAISDSLDAYVGCGYKACQAANLALFDAKEAIKKYDS